MSELDCAGCQGRRRFVIQTVASVGGLWLIGGTPAFATGRRSADAEEISYPIPAADGVTIDRDNEVILARKGNLVAAFALSCPHQRSMLKWEADDQRFQCTKHKSRYQLTGEFISGRATRHMDRYPVRREGGKVIVSIDAAIESDKDAKGWGAAVVAL